MLDWSEEDRARLVVSSALKRATLPMMKRNALLALAGTMREAPAAEAEAVRRRAAEIAANADESPIVRAAAAALLEAV